MSCSWCAHSPVEVGSPAAAWGERDTGLAQTPVRSGERGSRHTSPTNVCANGPDPEWARNPNASLALLRGKRKTGPIPPLRSAPRAASLRYGWARPPPTTNQTDRQQTHTRTYRDTQRHTQRPPPRSLTKACAIPDRGRRARAPSAAFEPRAPFPTGARARAAGGSAPATPPGPCPIGHAPGRAARLGARGCCACAEAAAAAPVPPARLSVRGRAGHASRSFILPVGNCSSNPRVSKRCKASLVTTGRCNFFFKILLKNSTTSKKQLLENVRAQYLTVTAKHCPKPQF